MGSERATALVTGAARGIGRATAVRLAEAGYDVVVADLDGAAAAATAAEIGAKAIELDVTDEASVLTCAAGIDELDVLVNNAGIYRRGMLADVTVEDYRAVFDVNLLGPLLMTRALAGALAAGGGGAVVNVASMSGIAVVPGTGVYSMAKAALISYTELAALEYAPRGIRVNAVAPGRIATEMTADRQSNPAREARTHALIPLGRDGTAEDVAEAICALASPGAAYITGQVIRVDGGLTIATVPFFQAAQGGH
ncbi:MAG: SDR family NAD(P)-dependent oxidoreductase [Sporichthyaceae bacterium]